MTGRKISTEYDYVDDQDLELPDSSVVLDFSVMAVKYAFAAPFRFQIVKVEKTTKRSMDNLFRKNQVYCVNYVKEMKVFTLKKAETDIELPINSSLKFGLIQDSNNKSLTYRGVEDVLNAKHLPKILAVVQDFKQEENQEPLLKQDEVLLVRQAMKNKSSEDIALRVFSLLSHRELVLPKQYQVELTINPASTKVHLSDLLDNNVDFMPCLARCYSSENTSSSMMEKLGTGTVAIASLKNHTSVIASLLQDTPTSRYKECNDALEIPKDIGLRVSILKTERSDDIYKRMTKVAKSVLKSQNMRDVQNAEKWTGNHKTRSSHPQMSNDASGDGDANKDADDNDVSGNSGGDGHKVYQKLLACTKDPQTKYEILQFKDNDMVSVASYFKGDAWPDL